MINTLMKVLKKSWRNPRYFLYFMSNVHFIRDHFPSVYRRKLERKALDLGNESNELIRLHVIMRTTDSVMNLNSGRKLDDAGIISKSDVIRVGGCSLFRAAERFVERYGRESLRITLVCDRLSEVGVAQYKESARLFGIDFDIVEARGHGNGETFQTQIDVALRDADDTLIFILEDDYLLYDDALTLPFETMRCHSKIIGFNPHFHPDRVRLQDAGQLVVIARRLFCRVSSTCCTFFMPVRQMRRFESHLRLYDGYEAGSVDCAWKKGVCLAPLGWTLAEHLHRCDLSPVQTLVTMHANNYS